MDDQGFTPIWKLNQEGAFLNAIDAAAHAHQHDGAIGCRKEPGPSAVYDANTRSKRRFSRGITLCIASVAVISVEVIVF